MKCKFEAVQFNGQSFDKVKSFKHEKEAIAFVDSHSELTLKRINGDGSTNTWNEQKEKWE